MSWFAALSYGINKALSPGTIFFSAIKNIRDFNDVFEYVDACDVQFH